MMKAIAIKLNDHLYRRIIDTTENPNDISISDAETQSGNEHEPGDNVNDHVHVDAQPSNNNRT